MPSAATGGGITLEGKEREFLPPFLGGFFYCSQTRTSHAEQIDLLNLNEGNSQFYRPQRKE